MTAGIEKLDPNMATKDPKGDILWYDVRALAIEGMGWPETEGLFERLPARAKDVVREEVWNLSKHSAGICARFVSDATRFAADWTLKNPGLAMDHMPATGMSGLDLYVRHEGKWRWLGVGRPTQSPRNVVDLTADLHEGTREYLLYMPLYNGVTDVKLGIPPAATLARARPRPARKAKPVVFYGTSITQGGCASRTGMSYPAILGRWLDRPAINMGFSGNGQMEIEVARFLSEIDAAAFVLDALPNVEAPRIAERAEPFVTTLRAARPQAAILLVENITYQNGYLVKPRYARYTSSNQALRKAYENLLAAGVSGLHYIEGAELLGEDGEPTVDGTHATDVGFLRIAAALKPVLKSALRPMKAK